MGLSVRVGRYDVQRALGKGATGTVYLARDTFTGREFAFKEGIVHSDIKPANLMIAEGTEVKISDFGAAYLRKSQAVQTAAMGSPYYMSPEQIAGKELTFHSDMYSLGMSLYELLVGKKPFTADSLEALLQKIRDQSPTPPSRLRSDLPKSIDAIILRATAKKPEHR